MYLLEIIQSARLFVQSSELGPPLTYPQASVAPPPVGSKGRDTFASGSQFRRREDTLVLYVYYNPSTVFSRSLFLL
jgi:hypothetical protein